METNEKWLKQKIADAEDSFEDFLQIVNKLEGYEKVRPFLDKLSDERFLEWIAFLQGIWYWAQMENEKKHGENPPFSAVALFDRYMTHVFTDPS